ncbi:hypothetical protein [Paraburkholderia heleia]|uniref:hypothetical protein n=1 Tax=Paraburkholderia heleia TaxID=634127 RepID=UPI002AB6F587|nr:hypothetical protein [Paraburkholderia heleia]
MKMFSKSSNTGAASISAKRDVTLCDESPKRPDHVRVESDECTWKIGLTLDEQHSLGSAYEWNERNGEFDKNFRIVAISEMLDGARRRGFANTGILLTLAASGAEARCFAALAQSAMEDATPEEVSAAVGSMQGGCK